jgi:hypothetical protein
MKKISLIVAVCLAAVAVQAGAAPRGGASFFTEGETLYKAGRFSEATDAFEKAIKQKERPQDSQKYIDRIRKETVERIRNRALTGVSKTTWQTKYYFIRAASGRLKVGISYQEVYERQSLNFRQGAVEALMQLADVLRQNDSAKVDLELISEINTDTPPNPDLLARQQAQLYSLLSLSAQGLIPKY